MAQVCAETLAADLTEGRHVVSEHCMPGGPYISEALLSEGVYRGLQSAYEDGYAGIKGVSAVQLLFTDCLRHASHVINEAGRSNTGRINSCLSEDAADFATDIFRLLLRDRELIEEVGVALARIAHEKSPPRDEQPTPF